MSELYRNYTINASGDDPWVDREINLLKAITDKLPTESGNLVVSGVHKHSRLYTPNGLGMIAESVNDSGLILSGKAPYQTLFNITQEDTDGGRESKLLFQGKQSGGEDSVLATIEGSHSGTSDDTTAREEHEYPEEIAAKNSGYFEVLTQYEKDRWVDFCVDADMEFRDQKNPHDDDELPVV